MSEVETALARQETKDPNDLTFLITHLRALPEDARRYIVWVSSYNLTATWLI